jgi:hypothetical protein
MKSDKVIIEETGLKNYTAKVLMTKLIDIQINICRMDYMAQFEKDHSITPDFKNRKIQELKMKKMAIDAYFNELNIHNSDMSIDISIELKVNENSPRQQLAITG